MPETKPTPGRHAVRSILARCQHLDLDGLQRVLAGLQELMLVRKQERTAELGQSARSELESELETIRAMRDRLAQRVDELGETSGAAWSEVVSGAESAWTELSEAVASAAERFDTSPPGGV